MIIFCKKRLFIGSPLVPPSSLILIDENGLELGETAGKTVLHVAYSAVHSGTGE